MEILELKDVKAVADIVHVYPERVKNEAIPLVIDNGAFLTSHRNYVFFFLYALVLTL